ncbi:protein kinase domain-containing protein [Vibrio tubiashii]|uniref:Serine/threonine protein kinase n=1 Tax=Vibrio tubiashii ATCC 19109 TaxID=1051646 RepID=F9T3W2_9VIBR|nr:protein kinase [Vibrio tubiashii]AIW17169.1 serine/threonine protein kinase [Vibrio tubiashii ATCC 19109]EGU56477.1 serine/threonine protein kinase [Vibrio tubiashii ATCC 19109]EIF01330.1 serine/threonine protein kinase [Vibrio tubiashii NCIMB 1337 = ATCC 19106]
MANEKIIGSGTYGIVKEVRTPNGLVAKKELIVTQDPDENERRRRRFKREVDYQAKLHHMNVVSILSMDLACEEPWFTMPLAECNLGEEAKNGITVTDNMKISAFRMILNGVEHIHASGQIHRDLKPENILRFKTNYNHYSYAISDFGLVAGFTDEGSTALTATNAVMGTIKYMPPECYEDAKRATEQSDIYSLGVILKFIIDGEVGLPFQERTSKSIFGAVISRCTKLKAVARFSDISELRQEFEKCWKNSGYKL